MMKTILGLVLISMLAIVAAPAHSAAAVQMWRCEMEDGTHEADVIAAASKWLNAAKTMKGGEKLEASVHFPVAVNNAGALDFLFVLVAPSFEDWGKFWDGYEGSPAAAIDKKNDKTACPNSAVWESVKVK
jgi:hypothetical protein